MESGFGLRLPFPLLCAWRSFQHFKESLCRAAGMAVAMLQDVELAFGQTKIDPVQQSGFEAGDGNGSGNRRGTQTRFHGRAHGFIRRQL